MVRPGWRPVGITDDKKKERDRAFLFTIPSLIEANKLKLFSCDELDYEGWEGRFPYRTPQTSHFFDNLPFPPVPQFEDAQIPFDRSFIQSQTMESLQDRNNFIGSIESLNQFDLLHLKKIIPNAFHEKAFDSIETFLSLCKILPKTQWPDLFFLWTAEVNRLDYFLTRDYRFIRAYEQKKFKFSKAKPVSLFRIFRKCGLTKIVRPPEVDMEFNLY